MEYRGSGGHLLRRPILRRFKVFPFFSSYFTLSFYPFHCNRSKSDARHSEARLNRFFKHFTGSNPFSRRVISLSLLFTFHSPFTPSLYHYSPLSSFLKPPLLL